MNKDLDLFIRAIKRLIYFTTKDEFGHIRSRGIGTYEYFAEELNQENIVPDRGYWTENSLKLFFPRVMKRYPRELYEDACDLDFVGRSSWEYLSYSKSEEVVEKRNHSRKFSDEYEKIPARRINSYTALYSDIEKWRDHEMEDIDQRDKKVLNDYNKSKSQTRN